MRQLGKGRFHQDCVSTLHIKEKERSLQISVDYILLSPEATAVLTPTNIC